MNRILELAGIAQKPSVLTEEVLTEGKKAIVERIFGEVIAGLSKTTKLTPTNKTTIKACIMDAYEDGHEAGYEEGHSEH